MQWRLLWCERRCVCLRFVLVFLSAGFNIAPVVCFVMLVLMAFPNYDFVVLFFAVLVPAAYKQKACWNIVTPLIPSYMHFIET